MSSLTVLVALTLMVTTAFFCSEAAPVTEFFGPPQTIEGDSDVIYPNRDQQSKVEEVERFHRTYENGTVEFKMALSNGHVQYQRISKKCIDGDTIQVFEGYTSEQYADGRYGTRYYVSDENGYRSSAVIIENQPPKLPDSGPYSLSWPRDIQNELSLLNVEDAQTKSKTLEDIVVKTEYDLEEEQLSNLNLGLTISNENSIREILEENKFTEEPLINPNSEGVQTDIVANSDLPSSTELPLIFKSESNYSNLSEEPESSTLTELKESSSIDVAGESSTEQVLNEGGTDIDIFEESSEVPILDSKKPINTLNISSEGLNNIPVVTSGTFLNDEITSTEKSAIFNNEFQESSTGVPEINEAKTETETASISGESFKIYTAGESSTDQILKEADSDSDNIEESSGFPTLHTNHPIEGELTGRSLDTLTTSDILSEGLEDILEVTTGTFLNDEVTLTDKSVIFNNEAEEASTLVPEIDEVRTETEISNVSRESSSIGVAGQSSTEQHLNEAGTGTDNVEESSSLPTLDTNQPIEVELTGRSLDPLTPSDISIEDLEEISEVTTSNSSEEGVTEQPALEVFQDRSTLDIVSETESNVDLLTSSPASEIENKSEEYATVKSNSGEIKIEESTEIPLEFSTKADDEVSRDVLNESKGILFSEKEGRSFGFLNLLPLPVNNSTNIHNETGSEDKKTISSNTIISEINEETTNKIEKSTEQPESNDDENTNSGIATEAEVIYSTQMNGLEVNSSESSDVTVAEVDSLLSTEQPLNLKSSEENSSEESKEKSTEHSGNTEIPE